MNDDHEVPPLRMDQVLYVAATMITHLINAQTVEGEAEEDTIKRHQTYVSLVMFYLCNASVHRERLAGVIEALATELRSANPQPTPV